MAKAANGPPKALILVLLAAAQFVVVLDASIVTIALPSIGADLGVSQDNLSWVINAYLLAYGGFLLLGGRMADLLGRRRIFVIGLLIFALASLFAGLAESDAWLIAARAGQGFGAALLSPAALSIILTVFADGPERNRALGVWGAIAGFGGAAGVLLGGVLSDTIGWEWIFYVNVPIVAVVVGGALAFVPEGRSLQANRSFDIAGAISITAGLSLLVFGIVEAADIGWGSVQTIVVLVLSFALIGVFIAIERRAETPLVRLGILRLRTVTGANVLAFAAMSALFAFFFFASLLMQQVLEYTPVEAGLAFLPMSLGFIVAAGIVSRLVSRLGFKPVLIGGLVIIGGGLIWISRVTVEASYATDLLGPFVVAAVGGAAAMIAITVAAVTGVEDREAGLGSGLINTSQQIGGALGIAILATISISRTNDALAGAGDDPAALPAALTEGFQAAFLAAAIIVLASAALAVVLLPGRESSAAREAVPAPE
jgi:EmrB/QacA subfamily drug resistance transporter